MDFLLNKRASDSKNVIAKKNRDQMAGNDSSDSTVHSHHFLFGLLEDSGIATSHDAHSLEFDDQIPITPPPTIIVEQHLDNINVVLKNPVKKIGTFEKSKASSSIPSLSINSSATINIHYYPEESIFWSYVIVFIAVTVQMLTHGLQLSFGVFFIAAKVFFKNDQLITIGKYKLLSKRLNLNQTKVFNLKRNIDLWIVAEKSRKKLHNSFESINLIYISEILGGRLNVG